MGLIQDLQTRLIVKSNFPELFPQEEHSWEEYLKIFSPIPDPEIERSILKNNQFFEKYPSGEVFRLDFPEWLVNGNYTKYILGMCRSFDPYFVCVHPRISDDSLTPSLFEKLNDGSMIVKSYRDLIDVLRSCPGICEVITRRYFLAIEDPVIKEIIWDNSPYKKYGDYSVIQNIYYDI